MKLSHARGPWRALFAAAVLSVGMVLSAASARADDLLVFAAASLKNALDDIDSQIAQEQGIKVVASYAASSALAKQIEQAAPADVFISADLDWMGYVAKRNLIRPASRIDLLGNRLVLVAPKDSKTAVHIAPGFPLATLLGDGRLAMADPAHVPAGKYGKAALEKLGVWASVAQKIAPADNVRAALLLVARGETPFGIVYATDAAAEPNVKIADAFPAGSYPPIVYPAAATASSKNPAAARYLAYLQSAAARTIFEKHGFTVLQAAKTN
ncbi:MAG TPA: molybdate ABC transporter substrate-binding protein [Alphaproteobacteria bacterium]|nr:molybdate ABC transporter substrate-binding protein [Alphaproteobacteria bacterium]